MSIRELDDGRLLIHCFGGCAIEAVVGAVMLDLSDLFPGGVNDRQRGPDAYRPFRADEALRLIDREMNRAALLILVAGRDGELTPDQRIELMSSVALIRNARVACGLRELCQ